MLAKQTARQKTERKERERERERATERERESESESEIELREQEGRRWRGTETDTYMCMNGICSLFRFAYHLSIKLEWIPAAGTCS